jgi:hypothetical protein
MLSFALVNFGSSSAWIGAYFFSFFFSSSSSSSSIGGAGGNPAYRTSAFEAICTLTPVLVLPFISRGTACQTSISKRRNYG